MLISFNSVLIGHLSHVPCFAVTWRTCAPKKQLTLFLLFFILEIIVLYLLLCYSYFHYENRFENVVCKMLAILFSLYCVNSSPPGLNGLLFADNIFRYILVNEKFCILLEISLKFVPKGPIDNNPSLAQIMAWRRIGDKPLSEPMLTRFTDAYMRHWGEMS